MFLECFEFTTLNVEPGPQSQTLLLLLLLQRFVHIKEITELEEVGLLFIVKNVRLTSRVSVVNSVNINS